MQKKKATLQMYADENADYTNFIPKHVGCFYICLQFNTKLHSILTAVRRVKEIIYRHFPEAEINRRTKKKKRKEKGVT